MHLYCDGVHRNIKHSELVCRTKGGGAGPPGVGSRPAQGYQRGQDLCDGERRGPGPSRGEQGKAREKRRGLFVRIPAFPKTAPALAFQM